MPIPAEELSQRARAAVNSGDVKSYTDFLRPMLGQSARLSSRTYASGDDVATESFFINPITGEEDAVTDYDLAHNNGTLSAYSKYRLSADGNLYTPKWTYAKTSDGAWHVSDAIFDARKEEKSAGFKDALIAGSILIGGPTVLGPALEGLQAGAAAVGTTAAGSSGGLDASWTTGFTDTGTAGGALDTGYAGSAALTGANGYAGISGATVGSPITLQSVSSGVSAAKTAAGFLGLGSTASRNAPATTPFAGRVSASPIQQPRIGIEISQGEPTTAQQDFRRSEIQDSKDNPQNVAVRETDESVKPLVVAIGLAVALAIFLKVKKHG